MALKAHLDPGARDAGSVDARAAERRALRMEASGVLPGGFEANVLIHNLSAVGLLLETDIPLEKGERLVVDLPETGTLPVAIVWKSERLYGCAFEQALSQTAIAAVQLRSLLDQSATQPGGAFAGEAGLEGAAPGALQTPPEPLGTKLNRLRRERGMTLAQVAEQLGVSKPTVWAWEKGKAKPVSDRIAAIAQVLGVGPQELEDRLGDEQHSAIVQECRLRIATAYGAHPDSVRIMIEV